MATESILFGEALQASAQVWLDELGKTDRNSLQALIELAVTERTRLSDCLDKLNPGQPVANALADFNRLRSRLNKVAKGENSTSSDLGLRLEGSKDKGPPSERLC